MIILNLADKNLLNDKFKIVEKKKFSLSMIYL